MTIPTTCYIPHPHQSIILHKLTLDLLGFACIKIMATSHYTMLDNLHYIIFTSSPFRKHYTWTFGLEQAMATSCIIAITQSRHNTTICTEQNIQYRVHYHTMRMTMTYTFPYTLQVIINSISAYNTTEQISGNSNKQLSTTKQ